MGSLLLALSFTQAATFTEDFSANPACRGWQVWGETNLFGWDATNQNLRVTWDSSRTNSFFFRPLETILASDDDFRLSFDLTFTDYAGGVTVGKPGAFEAAIGFLNLDQAMQTNFARGAGRHAVYGPRNLVEFDFFPPFGSFLPTIAQVIVGTNQNDWQYNHDNLQPMTPGQTFQVTLTYAAAARTLTTTVSNHAALYGPIQLITLPVDSDFRVATLSVSSYSDVRSLDSILAHGTVDNLRVETPPPPVTELTTTFSGGEWRVEFTCRSHWLYALERSTNWQNWSLVTPNTPASGMRHELVDSNPPPENAIYRVRAQRP